MLLLTKSRRIKVVFLASPLSLWPARLCQRNLITSSIVTLRPYLLMFPILNAFDPVFHFVSIFTHALQLWIANDELCLCLLFSPITIPYPCFPPLSSTHKMCPSRVPLTVLGNLCWGDRLCLHLSPAEPVINLHWLNHQAHSVCCPIHKNPADCTAAIWLIMVFFFPLCLKL